MRVTPVADRDVEVGVVEVVVEVDEVDVRGAGVLVEVVEVVEGVGVTEVVVEGAAEELVDVVDGRGVVEVVEEVEGTVGVEVPGAKVVGKGVVEVESTTEERLDEAKVEEAVVKVGASKVDVEKLVVAEGGGAASVMTVDVAVLEMTGTAVVRTVEGEAVVGTMMDRQVVVEVPIEEDAADEIDETKVDTELLAREIAAGQLHFSMIWEQNSLRCRRRVFRILKGVTIMSRLSSKAGYCRALLCRVCSGLVRCVLGVDQVGSSHVRRSREESVVPRSSRKEPVHPATAAVSLYSRRIRIIVELRSFLKCNRVKEGLVYE